MKTMKRAPRHLFVLHGIQAVLDGKDKVRRDPRNVCHSPYSHISAPCEMLEDASDSPVSIYSRGAYEVKR